MAAAAMHSTCHVCPPTKRRRGPSTPPSGGGPRRRPGGAVRLGQPGDAPKQLGPFVSALAHRIARFTAHGRMAIRQRVDAISRPGSDDFRRDASIFLDNVRGPASRKRIKAALARS